MSSSAIYADVSDIPMTRNHDAGPKKFEAFAVWNGGKSIGTFSNTLSATVAGSSVAFYKLEPVQ